MYSIENLPSIRTWRMLRILGAFIGLFCLPYCRNLYLQFPVNAFCENVNVVLEFRTQCRVQALCPHTGVDGVGTDCSPEEWLLGDEGVEIRNVCKILLVPQFPYFGGMTV